MDPERVCATVVTAGCYNSCNSWLLQLLRALTPYAVQALHAGALNLQDLKMTDQKRSKTGKCRTWKMTDQIAGLENARPGK